MPNPASRNSQSQAMLLKLRHESLRDDIFDNASRISLSTNRTGKRLLLASTLQGRPCNNNTFTAAVPLALQLIRPFGQPNGAANGRLPVARPRRTGVGSREVSASGWRRVGLQPQLVVHRRP
jgi:hypothetical protein